MTQEAPQEPELLAPVSELGIANLGVFERVLGGQAIDNIILGED